MESRLDKHKRYIGKLEKHIEATRESSRYSSDRFDILIISLSTSALILTMGFVNNILETSPNTNPILLKTSWLFFVLALISNLISQVSGYFTNTYEIKISTNLVRIERGKEPKGKQKRFIIWSSILNWATLILNGLSLIFLITGIIILVKFYSEIP